MPPPRRKPKPSAAPLPKEMRVPLDIDRYVDRLLTGQREMLGNRAYTRMSLGQQMNPETLTKVKRDIIREAYQDPENILPILQEKVSRFESKGGPDLNQAVPSPHDPTRPLPPAAYLDGPRRQKPRTQFTDWWNY